VNEYVYYVAHVPSKVICAPSVHPNHVS